MVLFLKFNGASAPHILTSNESIVFKKYPQGEYSGILPIIEVCDLGFATKNESYALKLRSITRAEDKIIISLDDINDETLLKIINLLKNVDTKIFFKEYIIAKNKIFLNSSSEDLRKGIKSEEMDNICRDAGYGLTNTIEGLYISVALHIKNNLCKLLTGGKHV